MDFRVVELVDGWEDQASSLDHVDSIVGSIQAQYEGGMLDFKPEVQVWVMVDAEVRAALSGPNPQVSFD